MTETVRVFVNGKGVDAPAGGRALDAIAMRSEEDAIAVQKDQMTVTDSRGLPVPHDTPLFNGAVFRLVPRRGLKPVDPSLQFDT